MRGIFVTLTLETVKNVIKQNIRIRTGARTTAFLEINQKKKFFFWKFQKFGHLQRNCKD